MNKSALYSSYVIDGQIQTLSPFMMIEQRLLGKTPVEQAPEKWEQIIDETIDPSPLPCSYDPANIELYSQKVEGLLKIGKPFPLEFSACESLSILSTALLDAIWKKGHFALENLCIRADWKWNCSPIGNMASFYNSVEAVSTFLDGLDMGIESFSFEQSDDCSLSMTTALLDRDEEDDPDEDILSGITKSITDASMSEERAISENIQPCEQDWLIYIPFDTCDFRLGGSALAKSQGHSGSYTIAPLDSDYFMDCYEVVREMVEDKVAIAGATVCHGGLMTALRKMTEGGCGAKVSISGIMDSYSEKDIVRVLFSEVPGVIIQIKDIDYDYIDAEFLLQDVAWFPIGHPDPSSREISIQSGEVGISGILQSLLGSQISEGED